MDVRNESDIEQLRRIALTQQSQIRVLLDVLQRQSEELDVLKGTDGDLQEKLALLNELQAKANEVDTKPAPKKSEKRKKQKGHGPKSQPKVERTEEIFELDEADQTCPSCGGELQPLEGQFEASEMVDVVEVSYRLVEVKRQKYACRCGGCVETAIGPDRAVEGGRYSVAFAAKVAIDKYVDHIPLTRQTRIMKRFGLDVGSQTLWDQLQALSTRLRPCYDALYECVLGSPVFGLDQTGWKRLDRKGGTPWQMWCLTTDEVVYHRIREDKSAASWNALVGDYQGVVVCDAMSTHGARECNKPGPTLAACWAHVVRKFRDAEADFPEASIPRDLIRELYAIEERAESDDDRRRLRHEESRKVLDELETWLLAQTTLKTTSLGEAIRYTLGYWPRLKVFVDDPAVPLDNNRTERGIRGPVVGRKNHYGSRSKRGTEVAALFYSLIESAKLVGVEPATYLIEAARAAKDGRVLLPLELADR